MHLRRTPVRTQEIATEELAVASFRPEVLRLVMKFSAASCTVNQRQTPFAKALCMHCAQNGFCRQKPLGETSYFYVGSAATHVNLDPASTGTIFLSG